jgi:predicted RNA-binding protein with PIN domain
MYYYIDGYNFLFRFIEEKKQFAQLREQLVRHLQISFKKLRWQGTIVFDGAYHRNEDSGRSYASPLVITYAPKGESADAYITEQIEYHKTPSQCVVVTNDRSLQMHVKSAGAAVMTVDQFTKKMNRNMVKPEEDKKQTKDTSINIERLRKIFEDLSN